ncbi:MAG: FecR domain-containing protein, partial [Novosphingobium sp.]
MVTGYLRRNSPIEAEAAAWLARIQDDERRDDYAEALQAWLAADSAHRGAFTTATLAWELIAGAHQGVMLTDEEITEPTWVERLRQSWRVPVAALAAACFALVVVGGGLLYFRDKGPLHYETAPGEQISIVLDDGSRISLNTRSAVNVDYSKEARRITLLSGEAMFEVSKDPKR